MDEQRAWVKSGRKKRLRILAAALAFCLLFTTYPDILEILTVFAAAGTQGGDSVLYVQEFESLPDEVREQTVPLGTGMEELTLPDTLEAVAAIWEGEVLPEDAEEGTKVSPEGMGEETESLETEGADAEESADNTQPEGTAAIAEAADPEDAELTQETHTVTMPEYQAENVMTVETLENTQETGAKKKTIFIEGITWQSEPRYDADTEGTYIFTAVLPDGYTLAEGVSLPEITVAVQADVENKPLTDAGELLEEILKKYFDGCPEDAVYDAVLAMDEGTRLSLTADFEKLLAALTEEDETDERLQDIIGQIERGIADAAAKMPVKAPVFFNMRAAASSSGSIPLRRISGSGEAFVYHSFQETTSFTAGKTYAFLNGVYGYEDAVASLGSGAILKATDQENSSLHFIWGEYGVSATVSVYVDVVTRGRDFDRCVIGGLYKVPGTSAPAEYRYFCGFGGAQNCGPYYAYTYTKESLNSASVSASLNSIEKQGSNDSRDYTVKVTFDGNRTVTLDEGSYTVNPTQDSDKVTIIVSDSEGNQINTEFQTPLAVRYDANETGVSGLPAIQAAWKGENFTVSAAVPTRNGYSFLNWKAEQTGTVYTKGQTISSFGGKPLILKAQWKDTLAPTVTCAPTQVMTGATVDEVKAAVIAALTITDNEPVEECNIEVPVGSDFTKTAGNKNITVKVTDKAGNATTETFPVYVVSFEKIVNPRFTEASKNLSATLENPGTDDITESGFVWGIMNAPTVTVNNGKKTTAAPVKTAGGTISVTADNLQKGVTYYARAYIIADGAAYYSEEISFGLGLPAYGTFTIKNNGNNTFTVTRSGGSEDKQTVFYRTVNGSAVGGTHFTHQASTLVFNAGETEKTITITEMGANTNYDGKSATAYSNADRTYSVELYRVTGGGTLGDTVKAVRTMANNGSYTVDRNNYTGEKSIVHVAETSGTNGKKIADTTEKQGGTDQSVSFLTNRDNAINYNVMTSLEDYYATNEIPYLQDTATGWYYRYDLLAYEDVDGYEHAYIGTQALKDVNYALNSKAAVVSGVPGQLWTCNFQQGQKDPAKNYYFPDTRTGGVENSGYPKNSNGTTYSYEGNTYVNLKTTDSCYAYFGSTGEKQDIWYVDGLKSYVYLYDNVEPKLIGVAPMAGGTYKVGDRFTVSLIFDEIVDRINSGNLNDVKVNTTWGEASYAGGVDTNVLYFTGTIAADAETTLKVNGFTNADHIKDMCNNASGTATTSGSGETTAVVDIAKPNISAASGGISNGTGKVTVKVLAAQSNTNSLRYAWSDSSVMPVTGWIEASSAELTAAKTNAGLPLSIRKEAGSGAGNGKWYLHVIGTYNATGAIDYKYACVDFGTVSSPAAGSEKPSLTVSADNSAWAEQRTISISAKGGTTLQYRKSGAATWTSLTATQSSVTVTENGYYTFRLTAADDVITQTVQVEKIDRVNPTGGVGTLQEGDSLPTAKAGVYTKLTLPVTFADSGSGVKTVQYAWTNSTATPSSWTVLSLTADQKQTGSAEITYTATESTETTKYLHIKVTDQIGHTCTAKSAAGYKVISQTEVKNHTPKITLSGAPTAWTNDMATLEWKLTDYAGKNYEVILPDGRKAKSNATSGNIWAMHNGSFTVKVVDLDYGGENTATVNVTYIDTTAPTVTASAPPAGWQNTAQYITLSASDTESGVGKRYYKFVDNNNEIPTDGLKEITNTGTTKLGTNIDGIWYLYYKYYDKTGDDSIPREANKTEGFVGPIKIDTKTPALTVSAGNTGVSKTAGLNISVKAVYGVSGGNTKVNNSTITALTAAEDAAATSITKQTDYKVTAKGTYVFTLTGGSGKTVNQSLTAYEAAFDLQGGTAQDAVTPQLVASGGTLTEPDALQKAGYDFKGWYTAAKGGDAWDFAENKVTADKISAGTITLYARWADETPPDKPVLQDGETLPSDWTNNQTTIPLKLYDSVGVTELWVSIDGGAYTKVSGFSGGSGEMTYDYAVTEGEHTYQFMAKDAAGNTSDESDLFTVKLDMAKPAIGSITYENKTANLWDWIIGKTSLIIHVPVADEGSGVTEITYTMTPGDAAGNLNGGSAVTDTAAVTDGEAKLIFNADFKGTITITCTDAAGNSTNVTIGADGGGVIVEDHEPAITANAKTDYYDTPEDIHVTVKDDTGNVISAGIASVTYQVGDGEKKTLDYTSQTDITSELEFDIKADEIPTGITEITLTATDNAGNMTTEKITVRVKGPEKQPAAAIDYRKEELTGLVPGGQYRINGTEITADAEGHIEIKEEWIGGTVNIVKKGNGSETTDSPAQSLTIPARPAAPDAPELDSRTTGSITVKTMEGVQYRIGDGGWQDSTTFIGLTEKTIYFFRAYYPATDTTFASPESGKAEIATMQAPPAADKLVINFTAETLTLDGVDAFSDADCTTPVMAGSAEDYMGTTVHIRYPAIGIIPASATTPVSVPERTPTPTPGKTDASYPEADDGAITGLTAGASYMVSPDNGGTWESRTADADGRITGLEAGTYEVYVAAGSTNFRSETAAVIIETKPATKQDTPDIRIDYEKQTLTGFASGETYTVNNREVTAGQDGTIEIDAGWFDATLSIIRKGNGKDKTDSDAQSLFVPAIPGAPTPTGVDVQTAGGTGRLTGLTAGTTYEVSTDGGRTWETRNADGSGEITELAPGTYTVRVKAGTSNFASEPGNPATIGAYKVTVTFVVNGEQYDTRTVDYGGTLTDIPAAPSKDSAVGDWYADEQGGSLAVFTNITADMTVYAVYQAAYTVTLQGGTGYTLAAADGSSSPVKEGGSFTFRYELCSGYKEGTGFAVKVSGMKVTMTADGTGGYTYTITDIRENQNVTVEGVEKIQDTGGSDHSGGGDDDNDDSGNEDNPQPTEPPADTPQPTPPSADTPQPTEPPAATPHPTSPTNPPGTPQPTEQPGSRPGIEAEAPDNRRPEDDKEPESAEAPQPTEQPVETEKAPEEDFVQTIPVSIDGGRLTISGKPIKTGNVKDMTSTSTALNLGDGAVIVTVVCKDQTYTAGVADTVAVANAVLTSEQLELVKNGETIEIRIEVTDISGSVPQQDKEVIESGIEEYSREIHGLVLGMYVDLSMYIKIGAGDWDAIATTREAVEVSIGIPEELKETGRTYYIIRAHEGEYTFMNDMDSAPDTITISTDRFSSYAIAYVQTDGERHKCGLCHICPTFLGICYFIWLAISIVTVLVIWITIRRKRKDKKEE